METEVKVEKTVLKRIKHLLETWAPIVQEHAEDTLVGHKDSERKAIISNIKMPMCYYTICMLVEEEGE